MSDQPSIPQNPLGDPPAPPAATWIKVVGIVFLGIAFLFFIVLSLLGLYTNVDLCRAKFPILVIISLAIAIGLGFLGGAAALEGKIPLPKLIESPFKFGVTGGVGAFLIVLLIGNFIWDCSDSPRITLTQLDVLRDGPTNAKVVARFTANSLTDRHHLVLEIASSPNFGESTIKTDEIKDWMSGQALTQFSDKDAQKIWARIRALDESSREVASSRVVEREVQKQ